MKVYLTIKYEKDSNPNLEEANSSRLIKTIYTEFPDSVWARGKRDGFEIAI